MYALLRHAPPGLLVSIMRRIHDEQEFRVAKRKLYSYGAIFSLSILGLVPALYFLRVEILNSGLLNYMSLLTTDAGALLANWRDVISGVLEAIPAMSLLALLGTGLLSLWSLQKIGEVITAALAQNQFKPA